MVRNAATRATSMSTIQRFTLEEIQGQRDRHDHGPEQRRHVGEANALLQLDRAASPIRRRPRAQRLRGGSLTFPKIVTNLRSLLHVRHDDRRVVHHRDLGRRADGALAPSRSPRASESARSQPRIFGTCAFSAPTTITLPTCWRPFSPQYHMKNGCAPWYALPRRYISM